MPDPAYLVPEQVLTYVTAPNGSKSDPSSSLPTDGGKPPINTVVFSGCVLLGSGSGKNPPVGAGATRPWARARARVAGDSGLAGLAGVAAVAVVVGIEGDIDG